MVSSFREMLSSGFGTRWTALVSETTARKNPAQAGLMISG
jgi:hypothetical protein